VTTFLSLTVYASISAVFPALFFISVSALYVFTSKLTTSSCCDLVATCKQVFPCQNEVLSTALTSDYEFERIYLSFMIEPVAEHSQDVIKY
jgi:hypothetical protein